MKNLPRWGILSTAAIVGKGVLAGMRKSPLVQVAAVASRDLARAQSFAAKHGITQAYGCYEDLLLDPDIDIVYNPLPNHLHVEWTLAAARAGKHVLCEKPFAIRAQDLEALMPYAQKVHLREAVMVRHHPQWIVAREKVRQGVLGKLRTIIGHFSYLNNQADNIRNQVATGGGALLDIGIYPITAARYFFETEPIAVLAHSELHPQFGTDAFTQAIVDFGCGRQLLMSCSTQAVRHQSLSLIGTQAQLEFELAFNPFADVPTSLTLSTHNQLRKDRETILVAAADQYQLQAEAMVRAVQTQAPSAQSLLDSIAQARVVDAIVHSAKTGRCVSIDTSHTASA